MWTYERSKILNVSQSTIRKRLYILQSRDKVIEYVEQYKKDKLKADKINKLSRENNIPVFTIRQRMNRWMTLEEASTKPVDKKHLPKNHPNRD